MCKELTAAEEVVETHVEPRQRSTRVRLPRLREPRRTNGPRERAPGCVRTFEANDMARHSSCRGRPAVSAHRSRVTTRAPQTRGQRTPPAQQQLQQG
jgi:hypothetical protein